MSNNASPMPSLRTSCFAAIAAVAVAACPKPVPPPALPPPTPDQVVDAGKTLLGDYERAYEARDFAALSPLYAHDLDVMVIVQGRAHRGWTDVETHVRGFLTRADSIRLDVSDVRVVALGDGAAEIRSDLRREYSEGAATRTEVGSLIIGLTRVDERWLIRSEHFSYGLR